MSLTLGRERGIAKPLKKRTVGQINIAHVYDGANHIWPTSVIHFSDFTSIQLRYIWGSDDGRDLDTKSYYVNSPINSSISQRKNKHSSIININFIIL